jgi:hypothetical protein
MVVAVGATAKPVTMSNPNSLSIQRRKYTQRHGSLEGFTPAPVIDTATGEVIIPPLEEHEARRLELKQKVRTMNESLLVVAEICHTIMAEKTWERFGFVDPRDFFETEGPIAYRTVQRAVLIWQAYLAVPEGERPDVLKAFEIIGTHKAGVAAPAIKEHPESWREWIEDAQRMTVEALQEKALLTRGLKSRLNDDAHDKLLGFLLKNAPDQNYREEIEGVFKDGFVLTGSPNAWAVLIGMVREVKTEWAERAARTKKGQANL